MLNVVFLLVSAFALGEATITAVVIWEHCISGDSVTFSDDSNVQIGSHKHQLSSSSLEDTLPICDKTRESKAIAVSVFYIGLTRLSNSLFTNEVVGNPSKDGRIKTHKSGSFTSFDRLATWMAMYLIGDKILITDSTTTNNTLQTAADTSSDLTLNLDKNHKIYDVLVSDDSIIREGIDIGKFGNSNNNVIARKPFQQHLRTIEENGLDSYNSPAVPIGHSLTRIHRIVQQLIT